jgi:transposase
MWCSSDFRQRRGAGLGKADFCCQACGFEDHADVNAARNILRLGLSLRRQKREAEAGAA